MPAQSQINDGEIAPSTINAGGLLGAIGFITLVLAALVQFLWKGTALFMREAGLPSETIGLLFLAGMPWVLRFLWAPLIDRHGPTRFGHFRAWIVCSSGLLFCLVLVSAYLSPEATPYELLLLITVMSAVMGTQQMALFGLMAKHLQPEQRVNGTTVMALSYSAAGILIGGGILYVLGDLGWRPSALGACALAGLGLLLLALFRLDAGHAPAPAVARFWDQLTFLKDKQARRLLFILLFINVAGAATYGLQTLMLVDTGFQVSQAATVSVVGVGFAGLLGALVSGVVANCIGGYRTLAVFGVLLAGATGLLGIYYLITDKPSSTTIISLILFASFAMLGLMPAGKAILISLCAEGRETTDFSSFSGLEATALMLTAAIATAAVDTVGYGTILVSAGAASLLGSVAAFLSFQRSSS